MKDSSNIREPVVAYIAIGSNLGDSRALVQKAFVRLQELSATPIRQSSLWRSTPVDCPPGSADFVNAMVAITPLAGETPESLLAKLQAIEIEFGRRPKQVLNESRPLDLDLIAFGDEVRATTELTLPHPRAVQRRFVLAPLSELSPHFILPGQKKTAVELLGALVTDERIERG